MKHSKFLITAKNTIIKNSNSISLSSAMKEWRFLNDVQYYNGTDKICELCGQKHLRSRYKIVNILNNNFLWVGSNCINKFEGIEVFDDSGRVIFDLVERKKQLEKILRKLKKNESSLQPLRDLYVIDKSNSNKILEYVQSYKSKGSWPRETVDLLTLMDHYNIKYDPSNYKIL